MKKFIFFLIIVILLIFILSEFIGDKIIKGTIETNISKSLNRETKIRNLKINYLKGEAILEDIILKNKNFPDDLLSIDKIYAKLKSSSIFSDNIEINKIELDGLNINYFFNLKNAKVNDNVKSLSKSLKNDDKNPSNVKEFNIEELIIKNVKLSINSPELKISNQISLNDFEFNNVGNTQKSESYKSIIQKIINDTIETVKSKVMGGKIQNKLEKLKKIDQNEIKNNLKEKLEKNKDKIENKLKKLLN